MQVYNTIFRKLRSDMRMLGLVWIKEGFKQAHQNENQNNT